MSISIVRGTTFQKECIVTNQDGTPFNLTGCVVRFTVKAKNGMYVDTDTDAIVAKTINSFDNPTAGIFELVLTNVETLKPEGSYFFDFKIKTASNEFLASYKEDFDIVQNVTQKTS